MQRGGIIIEGGNKQAAAAATVTDAESGTHLSGTKVRLGSNAGAKPLLANTDIRLGGFNFNINEGGSNMFLIDPVNFLFQFGDVGGINNATSLLIDDTNQSIKGQTFGLNMLLLDGLNGIYGFGDLQGLLNSMQINIDDSIPEINIWNGNDAMIRAFYSGTNPTIILGDDLGTGNRTMTRINDFAKLIELQTTDTVTIGDGAGNSNITYLSIDDVNRILQIFSGFNHGLVVDFTNSLYQFGDIDTAINGTQLDIDDINRLTQIQDSSSSYLYLDATNQRYVLGDALGGWSIDISDANEIINIINQGSGVSLLNLDYVSKVYSIGQSDGNQMTLQINDTNKTISFNGKIGAVSAINNPVIQADLVNFYYRIGDLNGNKNSTVLVVDDNNQVVKTNRRFEKAMGISVAAANDLTLGTAGNLFVITGNTQINAITTANWQAGSVLRLLFTGTPTVKHNTAGGAGTAVLLLNGSVDLVAANNTVLSLIYDGTQWQEISRKVA